MSENEEIAVKAHSNDINCCQISYNGIIGKLSYENDYLSYSYD